MKNRGWLPHRTGGMPGGAHRKSPTRAIRAWAARGALALAVAAGGAGAVAAAAGGTEALAISRVAHITGRAAKRFRCMSRSMARP